MIYGNFQIASMTTKGKCTVLSIKDKTTICEYLDNGSSKSEIAHEYKIIVSIYFMHVYLFDYPNFLITWTSLGPNGVG